MATNITFHEGAVSYDERCELLGQRGATVWLTGLSASGKVSFVVSNIKQEQSECGGGNDGEMMNLRVDVLWVRENRIFNRNGIQGKFKSSRCLSLLSKQSEDKSWLRQLW